jgi:hypothetical protein
LGRLSDLEKRKLDTLIPELEKSIEKGIEFARSQK